MKIYINEKRISFKSEDGMELTVEYDNRGEPYREGVSFTLEDMDAQSSTRLFLENYEVMALRDLLNKLCPPTTKR